MPIARSLVSNSIFLMISTFLFTRVHCKTYRIFHWGYSYLVDPYMYLGPGNRQFERNKCQFTNCEVTKYFNNFGTNLITFDAVVFDVYDLLRLRKEDIDKFFKHRSPYQKYIFTSTESEVTVPLCKPFLNNFFNWTWTYRLESTFRRGYITVYDVRGDVIGPKKDMVWMKHMKPIGSKIKKKLKHKSELAAWFVSNCDSKHRRIFVNLLEKALAKLGDYTVDIFGNCGKLDCGLRSSKCSRMLKRDYYFYFAFENSFAVDYVTEKLITALDNYNIPVVYGGADYSRFLPPGSYLNALQLGPTALAHKMVSIVNNVSAFHDYFRWRNHYVFKETTFTDDICSLCEMMNHWRKFRQHTVVGDFSSWWNGNCT